MGDTKNRDLIPRHKHCSNCGACCGPVPITEKEYKEIKKYVKENHPETNRDKDFMKCVFRVKNKCSIYPVRPVLCRLMGVVKGMECCNGNTADINGYDFMDMDSRIMGLINNIFGR